MIVDDLTKLHANLTYLCASPAEAGPFATLILWKSRRVPPGPRPVI